MIFGILSQEVYEQLTDNNYENRINGVQELKFIILNTDIRTISVQNMVKLLNFLSQLLEDINFIVFLVTLEVITFLVQKLDRNVEKYIKLLVDIVNKTLGDTRPTARAEYMRIFTNLMKTVGPQKVLDLVMGQLKHKKSRVRVDVIDIITAGMLIHPIKDFNIPFIWHEVAPYLVDSSRRVRHAALELFSLLDFSLEMDKQQPLIKAIKLVERHGKGDGLMVAINARRARHRLPRLTSDGIVEYALVLPTPSQQVSASLCSGADLDWVLSAGRISKSQQKEKSGSSLLHDHSNLEPTPDSLDRRKSTLSVSNVSTTVKPVDNVKLDSNSPEQVSSKDHQPSEYGQEESVSTCTLPKLGRGIPGRLSVEGTPLRLGKSTLRECQILPSYPLVTAPGKSITALMSQHSGDNVPATSSTVPNSRESSPRHRDKGPWTEAAGNLSASPTSFLQHRPHHHCPASEQNPSVLQHLPPLPFKPPATTCKPRITRAVCLKREASLKNATIDLSDSSGKSSQKSNMMVFANPEQALTQSIELMNCDDWEKKVEGLNSIRGLVQHYPNVLVTRLHNICLAVLKEVKNQRSGVSKVALGTIGDLHIHLGKSMDKELDWTARVLLQKAGKSNVFIQQELNVALDRMVENCTPIRVVKALLNNEYLNHLNSVVRKHTAQYLADTVKKIGSDCLLSDTRDLTDRILPAITKLAQDSDQGVRHFGCQMLLFLASHPEFSRMLEKYIAAKEMPYVRQIVSNLKSKELDGRPSDAPIIGRHYLINSRTVRNRTRRFKK